MPRHSKSHVIIIGAGVSGISAAAHLYQNSHTNFTILEADTRWGGRVRTEIFGQAWIELGANWIHGGSYANPVFNLANRTPSLLHYEGKIHRLTRKTGYFYRPHQRNIDKEMGEAAFDLFIEIEREASELYAQGLPTDQDLMTWVKKRFHDKLNEIKNESCRQVSEDILWGMVNYLRFHYGDDLEVCSANLYGHYWDIPGGDVKVPGGFVNVFQPLVDLIEDKIQFEQEVQDIDFHSGHCISVQTKGGDTFKGDHVIVAVPLGYLKAHHQTMFHPSLPEAKIKAIKGIGFGRVGKIFMEFEHPFWAKGEEGLKIAWGREAIEAQTFPQDWFKSILGFDEVLGNPKVLVCWIGGEGAKIMETLPKDEISRTITRILRDCTGDMSLEAPTRIVQTHWINHPLFLGTYSFGRAHSNFSGHIQDLMEPMLGTNKQPLVQFAGEATHATSYSTVHGARLAGLREAQRLIDFWGE